LGAPTCTRYLIKNRNSISRSGINEKIIVTEIEAGFMQEILAKYMLYKSVYSISFIKKLNQRAAYMEAGLMIKSKRTWKWD